MDNLELLQAKLEIARLRVELTKQQGLTVELMQEKAEGEYRAAHEALGAAIKVAQEAEAAAVKEAVPQ